MLLKNILLSFFILTSLIVISQTIDSSRRVDWSNAGVQNGIPCISEENLIFNILDYGGDGTGVYDNSEALNLAINQAELEVDGIKVIWFPEGEYLFNSSLRIPSNTIIRGEGYQLTKLIFDLNGENKPCFDTPIWKWGTYTNVISEAQKGDNFVIVNNTKEFEVGKWLEIEEDNNPDLMYTSPDWNVSYAQFAKGHFARVIAISEDTIFIDRVLKTDFDENREVRARSGELAENIGFENFYITRPNIGDSYFFYLKNVANVWIRGIYGYRTNKSFVQTERAVNFEIRGNYFERSYDYGGGGHGYGVSVGYHSTDGLIENNIFNRLRHHMIIAKGASGNVFGYNYSFDRVQGSDTNNLNTGWIPPDISIHGHWSYMNLFEGNISHEIHSADHWGPSGPGTTFFRNRLVSPEGIMIDDGSVNQNVVANELVSGNIEIDESATGTFLNANNVQGNVEWNTNSTNTELVKSYYLNDQPSFWDNSVWPSIGPEFEIGSGSNPAEQRWLAQTELAINYSCTTITSSKSYESHSAFIFPNPASYHIRTPKGEVKIYSLQGVLVLDRFSNGIIDVSKLSSGSYIIEIGERKTQLIIE